MKNGKLFSPSTLLILTASLRAPEIEEGNVSTPKVNFEIGIFFMGFHHLLILLVHASHNYIRNTGTKCFWLDIMLVIQQ